MEHQLRLSILPSQCYSSSDDMLDSSHGNATARQPLQESSGNAQQGESDRIMSSYARRVRIKTRRSRSHFSMVPSILTPPIVPTQALGSTYGSPVFARPHEGHEEYLRQQQSRRMVNPICLYPEFVNYRDKQNGKVKKDQIWPRLFEDAFLDALLIIPHIGRSKFVVNQILHGRNMLISEYLWHDYVLSLPPGVEPDEKEYRGRKQVSSHIQVLKGIFRTHRCCHIILPREITGKSKEKNEVAMLPSLRDHPVLVPLSKNKFPHERADYAYFSRILELDKHIVIRPKRCWIFVAHKDVVVDEDGSGLVRATGQKLARQHYPHLRRNFEREKWSKAEKLIFTGSLVHEYTKRFAQVESGTVRELSAHWKSRFPYFHQHLESMIAANAREDMVAAEAKCDIMHMHVTLETHTKQALPTSSELNSWVQVNIEKPQLLNHRWKVQTRLVRPPELAYSDDKSTPQQVYEVSAEVPIQYEHDEKCMPGCVSLQCRRAMVPFPADIFARTLTNCAEYQAHPPVREVKIVKKDDGKKRKNPQRRTKAPKEKIVHVVLPSNTPTQMDLVPGIAMMQEIWSCPPGSPQDHESGSQSSQRWTRRGLILWSFQTLHSVGNTGDDKGALLTAAGGGTAWRFLTILDPMSDYHLQRSLLPNAGEDNTPGPYHDSPTMPTGPYRDSPAMASFGAASRDMIMSPNPPYQEHLNASMSENFGAAWAPPGGIDPLAKGSAAQAAYESHLLAQKTGSSATTPAAYPILAGYSGHGGLATPPPTASLGSSFATSFDSQPGPGNYMAPAAGMDDPSLSFNGTASHHHHPAGYSTVTYGEIHDQVLAWDGGSAWRASAAGGYVSVPAPQHDIHWEGHHPTEVRPHYQHPYHRHPYHQQQREHWAAASHLEDADAHHQHMWRPSLSLSQIEHQHQHYGHGSPPDRDGWVDVGRPKEEEASHASMGTRSCPGSGTVTPHHIKEEEEQTDGREGDDLSRDWEEVVGAGVDGGDQDMSSSTSSLVGVHQFQGHSVLDEGLQTGAVGGGRWGA